MNIKRSSFIQSFLIYFMIVLISLSLSGCKYIPGIPPTDTPNDTETGTVIVTVQGKMNPYSIFMEGKEPENRLGQVERYRSSTFENIPIGMHTFYAINDLGGFPENWYYQSVHEVFAGENIIEIQRHSYFWI